MKLLKVIFFIIIFSNILFSYDFNIIYSDENIEIDKNNFIFKIENNLDTNYFLENIDLNIDSNIDFFEIYLYDNNFNFFDFNKLDEIYRFDINKEIDSNNIFYLDYFTRYGINNKVDFNITDINLSIDKNIITPDKNYDIIPYIYKEYDIFKDNIKIKDFSDIFSNSINDTNLDYMIDNNFFQIYLNNKYFLDLDFEIDSNSYKSIDFDLNNFNIDINNQKSLALDYNISNFYKDFNNLYLISDSNLYVYDKDYNYLIGYDFNQTIYNLDIVDYNQNRYLLISNKSNGILTYDISGNNILDMNNNFISSIKISDFNSIYLDVFNIDNNYYVLDIVSDKGFLNLVNYIVFYSLDDVLDGNNFVSSNTFKQISSFELVDRVVYDKDYNSIYISSYDENKTSKIVYNSSPFSIYSFSNKPKGYFNLDIFEDYVFNISEDKNQIEVYDLNTNFRNNFLNFTSPIKTYDFNKQIHSFNIDKKYNKFILFFDNNIIFQDYNNLDLNYLFNFDLNVGQENLSSITSNNLFFKNKNHFSQIYLLYDYNLEYFLPPYKINNLNLSKNNITKDIYDDFDGNISFSFNLYNYNFDINSLITLYLDDLFVNNYLIDKNSCLYNLNNYLCTFDFNIKYLNNKYNLDYKTYNLNIYINDINFSESLDFKFDLTSEKTSSPSSSKTSSSRTSSTPSISSNNVKTIDKNIYLENIDILYKDYLNKKNNLKKYFLDINKIDFNLSVDSNNFLKDYNNIINRYNQLKDLNIIKKYKVSKKIDSFNYDDSNKFVTEIIYNNKKFYFIEIYKQKDINYFDSTDFNKIIKSKFSLKKDINFIIINKDNNFLTTDSNQFNIFYLKNKDLDKNIYKNIIPIKKQNITYKKKEKDYLVYLVFGLLIVVIVYKIRKIKPQ